MKKEDENDGWEGDKCGDLPEFLAVGLGTLNTEFLFEEFAPVEAFIRQIQRVVNPGIIIPTSTLIRPATRAGLGIGRDGFSTNRADVGRIICMRHVRSDELAVVEQALAATLAAEATFLVAAEGRRGVKLVVSVGPDHAGLELGGHLQDA